MAEKNFEIKDLIEKGKAKGGSLTIFGALSSATGNPADDIIVSEMKTIANAEIVLDSQLAMKRVYPAIMPALTHVSAENDETFTQADFILRQKFLPSHSVEELLQIISKVETEEELLANLMKQ